MILRLGRDTHAALIDGRAVVLSPTEWAVVLRLASGRLVSKSDLCRTLYNDIPDYHNLRALATAVWRVSRKLGVRIKGYSSGYRMEGVTMWGRR